MYSTKTGMQSSYTHNVYEYEYSSSRISPSPRVYIYPVNLLYISLSELSSRSFSNQFDDWLLFWYVEKLK